MIGQILNPCNDWAFKHLFGSEQNEPLLIELLNAVLSKQLHRPIENITYLKRSQDPELKSNKQSVVDVLCTDQDGCQYIIEMQLGTDSFFIKRAQYYAAKAYSRQLKQAGEYQNLKEIIFLSFCKFTLFKDNPSYKHEHWILDNKTYKRELKDFSFTFVELLKFKKLNKPISEMSREEKFYEFLAIGQELSGDQIKQLSRDGVIKKTLAAIDRYNMTPEQLAAYEDAEKQLAIYTNTVRQAETRGIEKGKAEGKAEGLKEGKAEGLKEGKEEGLKEGKEEGLKEGKEEGLKEGKEEGLKEGKEEGLKEGKGGRIKRGKGGRIKRGKGGRIKRGKGGREGEDGTLSFRFGDDFAENIGDRQNPFVRIGKNDRKNSKKVSLGAKKSRVFPTNCVSLKLALILSPQTLS